MLRAAVVSTMVGVVTLAGCGGEVETSGLDLPEYRAGSAPAPAADDPAKGDGVSVVDELTGSEILARAQSAVAAVTSVSIEGSTTGSDGFSFAADLAFNGPDGSGTFTLGEATYTVLLADGKAYYKGDDIAYSSMAPDPKAFADKLGDRWILEGTKNPDLLVGSIISSRQELLSDYLSGGGDYTPTGMFDVDGIKTVRIENESGSLYVAVDTVLPVKMTFPGDEGEGLRWSYGDVEKPVAPAADEVADLAELA